MKWGILKILILNQILNSNINIEDINKKSCVLCSKKFSKIDLKFDSPINTYNKRKS